MTTPVSAETPSTPLTIPNDHGGLQEAFNGRCYQWSVGSADTNTLTYLRVVRGCGDTWNWYVHRHGTMDRMEGAGPCFDPLDAATDLAAWVQECLGPLLRRWEREHAEVQHVAQEVKNVAQEAEAKAQRALKAKERKRAAAIEKRQKTRECRLAAETAAAHAALKAEKTRKKKQEQTVWSAKRLHPYRPAPPCLTCQSGRNRHTVVFTESRATGTRHCWCSRGHRFEVAAP